MTDSPAPLTSPKTLKSRLLRIAGYAAALILSGVIAFALIVERRFRNDAAQTYAPPPFEIHSLVAKADVQLGKRIYSVRAGCIDCHGAELTGVKVMEDPAMGHITGANITPARLTSWTDEEIARAIRYGVHQTGRSLRFMPVMDYEGMSLSDLAALIAYLRSMPASTQMPPELKIGPMAKALSFANQMPILFPAKVIDQTRGFGEKPTEGPTIAFGKYLAQACTGCHGADFRGGKIPGGDPAWPEAANIRWGATGKWTEASFIEMAKSGISPRTRQKIRQPMPLHLIAQMDATETTALVSFLNSLD